MTAGVLMQELQENGQKMCIFLEECLSFGKVFNVFQSAGGKVVQVFMVGGNLKIVWTRLHLTERGVITV